MYSYIKQKSIQKDNLFKGKIFAISIFYEVSRTFWRNHQSKIMAWAWSDPNFYLTQEFEVSKAFNFFNILYDFIYIFLFAP